MASKYGGVYWCRNCNVPLLTEEFAHEARCDLCGNDGRYAAFDLKPLFDGERRFLESRLGLDIPVEAFVSRTRVLVDGETYFHFKICDGEMQLKQPVRDLGKRDGSRRYPTNKQYWDAVIEANRTVLSSIETEALEFIRRAAADYVNYEMAVLFSAGKDSAVAAWLTQEALGREVPLVYADTTNEFPASIAYAHQFAEIYSGRLHIERPEVGFLDFCRKLAPPSYFARWCCTVVKSNPVSKYIRDNGNVLCFDGIRAAESSSRERYPRVQPSRKLAGQISAHPIQKWLGFGVWLYILDKGLPINEEYKRGQWRIGCMLCPYNTPYDEFLMQSFHPQVWTSFEQILLDYADKRGLSTDWVQGGKWKRRRVRHKFENTVDQRQSNGRTTFTLNDPLDEEKLEYLRPFGGVHMSSTGEFDIQSCKGTFSVTGQVGKREIHIDGGKESQIRSVGKQIEKALNCLGCGGCLGTCPSNAIILSGSDLVIDEEKCTHCGQCLKDNFVKKGCIALLYRDQLRTITPNKLIHSTVLDSEE